MATAGTGSIKTRQEGLFIATENLSGGTLSAAIGTRHCPEGSSWLWRARVRSWFPMEEAFRQAAGVASALAYMHDEAMPVSELFMRCLFVCRRRFSVFMVPSRQRPSATTGGRSTCVLTASKRERLLTGWVVLRHPADVLSLPSRALSLPLPAGRHAVGSATHSLAVAWTSPPITLRQQIPSHGWVPGGTLLYDVYADGNNYKHNTGGPIQQPGGKDLASRHQEQQSGVYCGLWQAQALRYANNEPSLGV